MPQPSLTLLLQQATLVELGLRMIGVDESLPLHAVRAIREAAGAEAACAFVARGDQLVLEARSGDWPSSEPVPRDHPYAQAALAADGARPITAAPPQGWPSGRTGFTVRLGHADRPLGFVAAYGARAAALAADALPAEGVRFAESVAMILTGTLERAATARELRESEARARAVLETTVDGVITIGVDGTVESFNPAAERIFGYEAAEVVGRNVHVLMPEPYRAEHDGYLEAYRTTGRRKIIGIGREVRGRRKDGSTFPMDLAVSEVDLGGRTIFTGLVRDISDRVTLERELLRVAEEERRRIGQDLHDGLGQMLTGTALIARSLARQVARGELPTKESAEEVVELIKDADVYARRLARGLAPVELDGEGLSAALERLAKNAQHFFGIACSSEETVDPSTSPARLSSEAAANLFRIAQEAVSNAVRHGKARSVQIRLSWTPDYLRLRVHDDGRGFEAELVEGGRRSGAGDEGASPAGLESNPQRVSPVVLPSSGSSGGCPMGHGTSPTGDAPPPSGRTRPQPAGSAAAQDESRGMGLHIMRYRAHVAGGSLEIASRPGSGTTVSCSLPLSSLRGTE